MNKTTSLILRYTLVGLLGFITFPANAAVSSAVLNSWFVSGQGENAQIYQAVNGGTISGPLTTWTNGTQTQSSAVVADIQKVQYSTNGNYVYVTTPDLASYIMGPWWSDSTKLHPFINLPTNQSSIFRVALNTTYPSGTHGNTVGGPVGIAVNGVVIYSAGDAFSYTHSTGADVAQPGGDGIWHRMAEWAESATFDHCNGHQPGNGQYHYHTDPPALRAQLNDNIDYVGSTNYFPYDPTAYYLTHGQGTDGTYVQHTTNLHHSPIIGWMFDGYPIYGPYGYSNATDSTSAVTRMTSSFSLRTDLTTGSARVSVPGWSAALDSATLGATAAATAANAIYTMTAAQQSSYAGPAVSTTYPLGRYGEDYAYVPGSGALDQFNGRWCVTPEFPNGTYAYFITIDTTGAPAFPYLMNRQYYGTLNGSGKVTTISEAVTTAFDVSANTAPVVAGPGSASVAHVGTLSFTGSGTISVSDVDAAATENVTLTVNTGTLSVDRTGTLAALTTITAGANGSPTLTLRGAISELNAALATLTFSAPNTGGSATLTVQANDGGASGNTLSTTIALTNVAPVVSGPMLASVARYGTFAFTGSNVISVSDSDSANETVTLIAASGILNVTVGGATVTGNGTGSMTIAGTLASVNAALGTLTYTAPGTGASTTVSVQANDGSPTNNLNTLVTTITLTSSTPVVTTPTSASIASATATLGGNVISDGGASITARGVVYAATATNNSPQIGGTGVTNVTGTGTTGVFVISTTNLTPGTTYSFVGYATNSVGTTYSAVASFSTLTPLQDWQQSWYGSTSNGNAAYDADPYHTGIPNLLVFAFLGPNQDPAQAKLSQLPQIQMSSGNVYFTFAEPTGVNGVTYGAEWSATLQTNDWHSDSVTSTVSGAQYTFSVPIGSNPKLFIRLKVTSP